MERTPAPAHYGEKFNDSSLPLVAERRVSMSVEFNHTIVWSKDRKASAAFLVEMLGLPEPTNFGPFEVVKTSNAVNVDFADANEEVHPQHYAFLISEQEFDEVLARLADKGLTHWSDPRRSRKGEINTHDGGRGLYFEGLDGHLFEVITRPYGSGGWQP
jgi:catechol 2,3-dioxygenase-like lactoylglutathione lyase family enzyme